MNVLVGVALLSVIIFYVLNVFIIVFIIGLPFCYSEITEEVRVAE